MAFLTVADLVPFVPNVDAAKAQAMIDDASALASVLAPCINGGTFTAGSAVKAILRGAIIRWLSAGSGAASSVQVGQVQMGFPTQDRRAMFWPAEIQQLQSLCSSGSVYSVSLAGPDPVTVNVA